MATRRTGTYQTTYLLYIATVATSLLLLIGRQVQRTAEPVEEVSEGATGWGAPGGNNPDAPEKDSGDYDEEGGDGKAMKLTLMEEVLLLGLKDREVSPCP